MHLHPAVRFGLRRRNAGAYLSADMAKLVRVAGPLAHDQSPLCSCFARAGGVTPSNRNRQLRRDSLGLHTRSEEHTSELQSHSDLVCRLLLEKKKKNTTSRRMLYLTNAA